MDRNVRCGDFDEAIQLGEKLIQKTPEYPEAHQRLARAYLAAGDVKEAKNHFEEAFRLFPSQENEMLVLAIVKRNAAVNSQRDSLANEPPPTHSGTNSTISTPPSRR